jgi:chromosome segregation ATPase
MSKTTKAELEAQLRQIQTNWFAPHQIEDLAVERDNLREQLQMVKAARDDLEKENQLLRQQRDQFKLRARQDQEELTRLELSLEQLIPPEFLGEEWSSLVEPAERYIRQLASAVLEADKTADIDLNSMMITPPETQTIRIPIEIEIKVRHG